MLFVVCNAQKNWKVFVLDTNVNQVSVSANKKENFDICHSIS